MRKRTKEGNPSPKNKDSSLKKKMSLLIRDAAIWLKAVITLKNLSSVSGIFTGK